MARPRPLRLVLEVLLVLVAIGSGLWGMRILPQLPDPMPVHFDLAGRPDGFEPRGPRAVWLVPAVSLVVNAAMALFGVALLAERRRLHGRARRPADAVRLEQLRLLGQLLTWSRVVLVAEMCLVQVLVLRGARAGRLSPFAIGAMVLLPAVLLVGGLIVHVLQVRELRHAFATLGGPDAEARPGWKAGGLVYADRSDPSIVVERPGGLGATLNLGRAGSWWLLALLVAFPLAVVVLLVLV